MKSCIQFGIDPFILFERVSGTYSSSVEGLEKELMQLEGFIFKLRLISEFGS